MVFVLLSEFAYTIHKIFDTARKEEEQWLLSLFDYYLQLVLLDHKHELIDLE